MYSASVDSALYFPAINPPRSSWLMRTILYWDKVGVIVPRSWQRDLGKLGPDTKELIDLGLVVPIAPDAGSPNYSRAFDRWISAQTDFEMKSRRRDFEAGGFLRLHIEKDIAGSPAFRRLVDENLAAVDFGQGWMKVESKSGREFMAALALDLCRSDPQLGMGDDGWIPITDDDASFEALQHVSPRNPENVDQEVFAVDDPRIPTLRKLALENCLPMPAGPFDLESIVSFKERHSDLLPRLRIEFEERLTHIRSLEQESIELRDAAILRMRSETRLLVQEAEAYLREGRFSRLFLASLARLVKFVPVLNGLGMAVEESITDPGRARRFRGEGLAYLALAWEEGPGEGPGQLDWNFEDIGPGTLADYG